MTNRVRTAGSTAFSLGALLLSLMLSGCDTETKLEPVKAGEMDSYRDPGYGYTVQYPKGWISNVQVGHASFYNAQEVDKKFLEPTGQYPDGVVIEVDVTHTPTPDQKRKEITDDMTKNGFVLAKEEPMTVGGKSAFRDAYTGQYTKTIKESGQHIYITVDTLLYDIRFAGFGPYYDAYKAVFDASLNTFQFPKPVVPGRDATLPSEAMTEFNGKFLSFQYPDNYNSTNPSKGSNDEVVELRGQRQDCSIRVEVFGAKGLTLDKVFDQNKGKFRATGTGKATIGGQPGQTLTYAPTPSVERRFVFVVRNDKVYRITMDWYKPQKEDYLAAYEKVLGSIKFK
ncbi:MAG TPA: hypothetical protein VEO56_05570 [Bacteroidota bacterium]|nr:hypothetical protein [Bacteroidota bacterium]